MQRGEIVIRPTGGALPGIDGTLAGTDGVDRGGVVALQWHIDGSLTVIYWLTAGDEETVDAALAEDGDVAVHETVTGPDGDLFAFVHAASSDLMAGLLAAVDGEPILVETPIRRTEGGWRLGIVGPEPALRRAHERATAHVAMDIERLGRYRPADAPAAAALTERQREAVATARALGFYDEPASPSFEEIGEALAVALAGCAGPGGGTSGPGLAVTDASGAPGDTVTVTVTSRDVERLRIGGHPNASRGVLFVEPGEGGAFPPEVPATHPVVGFGGIAHEPSPDSVLESFPPIWVWGPSADEVTTSVPVRIQDETPPGRYGFEVTVEGEDGNATATAWIEVSAAAE